MRNITTTIGYYPRNGKKDTESNWIKIESEHPI